MGSFSCDISICEQFTGNDMNCKLHIANDPVYFPALTEADCETLQIIGNFQERLKSSQLHSKRIRVESTYIYISNAALCSYKFIFFIRHTVSMRVMSKTRKHPLRSLICTTKCLKNSRNHITNERIVSQQKFPNRIFRPSKRKILTPFWSVRQCALRTYVYVRHIEHTPCITSHHIVRITIIIIILVVVVIMCAGTIIIFAASARSLAYSFNMIFAWIKRSPYATNLSNLITLRWLQ